MKQLLSLLFVFILGCKSNSSKPFIQTKNNLTVIDSAGIGKEFFPYDKKDREGFFPIFFIGKIRDTLKISEHLVSKNFISKYETDTTNVRLASAQNAEIIVDTNFDVAYKYNYTHCNKDFTKSIIDSTKFYKSFLIFIKNKSDTVLYVGDFNFLKNAIRQVKNNYGVWQDIEKPKVVFCGTNARENFIEKNEILVAKIIRFHGNKKRECRIRYSNINYIIYSNSYWDYVDEKQLTDSICRN